MLSCFSIGKTTLFDESGRAMGYKRQRRIAAIMLLILISVGAVLFPNKASVAQNVCSETGGQEYISDLVFGPKGFSEAPEEISAAGVVQEAFQELHNRNGISVYEMPRLYDATTGITYVEGTSFYHEAPDGTIYNMITPNGVAIIDYNGSNGASFVVPSKINGKDVVMICLGQSLTNITSIDCRACTHLGAITFNSNNEYVLNEITTGSLTELQVLLVGSQNLDALHLSLYPRLKRLVCNDNRIADVDGLVAWLSVSGHNGFVYPQRVLPESEEELSDYFDALVFQQTGFGSPITTYDGTPILLAGGTQGDLEYGGIQSSVCLYPNGSFRAAFGGLVDPRLLSDAQWAQFKRYVGSVQGGSSSYSYGSANSSFGLSFRVSELANVAGSFVGFFEGYVSDDRIVITNAKARLNGSAGFSFEASLLAAPLVLIGGEGAVGFQDVATINVPASGSATITNHRSALMCPKATLQAGIGLRYIANVSVYGSFSNYINLPNSAFASASTGWFEGEAGVKAKCMGFTYPYVLISGRKNWSYSQRGESLGEASVEGSTVDYDETFVLDESLALAAEADGPDARDNAFSELPCVGSEGDLDTAELEFGSRGVIKQGVFNDADPQLALSNNGTKVLVWADTVPNRPVGDNVAIYYSTCASGTSNWSAPVILHDDYTADFSPSLAVNGTTAYVVWMNASSSYPSQNPTLSNVAQMAEIEVAAVDLGTGTVSTSAITSNSAIDYDPALWIVGGTPHVVWASCSSTDLSAQQVTYTLHHAYLSAIGWVEVGSVSEPDAISSLHLGNSGLDLVACWVVRDSQTGETSIRTWDGLSASSSELASDLGPLFDMQMVTCSGGCACVWTSNGNLMACAVQSGAEPCVLAPTKYSIASWRRMGASASLLMLDQSAGDGLARFYSRNISVGSGYVSAGQSQYEGIVEASVKRAKFVHDGGSLLVCVESGSATIGNGDVAETTNLIVEELAQGPYDFAITDVFYDVNDLQPDRLATMSVRVVNYGYESPDLIDVVVSYGNELQTTIYRPDDLSEGYGEQPSFEFFMPATVSTGDELSIWVELHHQQNSSESYSSNVVIIPIGSCDLNLGVQLGSDGTTSILLANEGRVESGYTLSGYKAGQQQPQVSQVATGTDLSPGELDQYSLDLDDLVAWGATDGDAVVLEVEAVGDVEDSDLSNNTASVLLQGVVEELYGSTCYTTAVSIANRAYPNGCDAVILAKYNTFLDAGCAIGAAGILDAPILYTNPESYTQATRDGINSLLANASGGGTVYIIGGTDAVPASIASQIQADGHAVVRLSGSNAQTTAVAVHSALSGWGDTAVVTTMSSAYDMLSVTPYLYGSDAPLFYAASSTKLLCAEAVGAIANGGFDRVVIVGGTAAVDAGVVTQLRGAGFTGEVRRISGGNAYTTNSNVVGWLVGEEGYRYHNLAVASAAGYQDAIAGSSVCGTSQSVLFLATDASTAGYSSVDAHLVTDACREHTLRVRFLGGTAAVSPETRTRVLLDMGWLD